MPGRRANAARPTRFGAEATALRGELYEVHRLVEAIVFRFPAVMTRGESAQSADDPA
nr:hypothetical protein [Rhodococcus wratislaviensis]